MNGWGIAALAITCGCLVVAVWTLLERYRYKTLFKASEKGRELAQEAHEKELEKYRKYIEGQKDDLKKGDDVVIHYSNKCEALQKQLDEALVERDKLALQLKEATEAKTRAARARTNRAKSPAQE